MSIRPSVNVYTTSGDKTERATAMPGVFQAPIRTDIVSTIHDLMRKNGRQAQGVKEQAGHMVSAESWGTGRAVARIPRVRGGGTHRSGQGAFGNMCRGGHMFNPTKTWRRWHRKINVKQRRYALTSAIAATGIPALNLARGHRVEMVPEIPLVIEDQMETIKKTKDAKSVLVNLRAWSDIQKVYASAHTRAGKGKMRNRRTVRKRGPIIIYNNDNGICRAFRNIPGITLINVARLNLLKMAPGGHLGRMAIWTESAFKRLDAIYGTKSRGAAEKANYHLPRNVLTNDDITRIMKSTAVQKILRPRKMACQKHVSNARLAKSELNPYALTQKKKAIRAAAKARAAAAAKKA